MDASSLIEKDLVSCAKRSPILLSSCDLFEGLYGKKEI